MNGAANESPPDCDIMMIARASSYESSLEAVCLASTLELAVVKQEGEDEHYTMTSDSKTCGGSPALWVAALHQY